MKPEKKLRFHKRESPRTSVVGVRQNMVGEMEKIPSTFGEKLLLKEITKIAFKEMGERTRIASGDDNFYVDGPYNQLKKDNNSKILVKIVFRLCKQIGVIEEN